MSQPEDKPAQLPRRFPVKTTSFVESGGSPNYNVAEKITLGESGKRSYFGSRVDGRTFVDTDYALATPREEILPEPGSKRNRRSNANEIRQLFGEEAYRKYLAQG